MSVLAWAMMGLALWHFTIWLPDRFWAGIVGAFVGALFGSVIGGFIISGLTVPSRADTDILTVLEGIPGAIIGMALVYWIGLRQERSMEPIEPSPGRA
jgi:hypothetical protein